MVMKLRARKLSHIDKKNFTLRALSKWAAKIVPTDTPSRQLWDVLYTMLPPLGNSNYDARKARVGMELQELSNSDFKCPLSALKNEVEMRLIGPVASPLLQRGCKRRGSFVPWDS